MAFHSSDVFTGNLPVILCDSEMRIIARRSNLSHLQPRPGLRSQTLAFSFSRGFYYCQFILITKILPLPVLVSIGRSAFVIQTRNFL